MNPCKKEEYINLSDENAAKVVPLVDQHLKPLEDDPLLWSDDELNFLDPLKDAEITGMGEATHGTSEFFNAKHRVFRYLVEKLNYKIFAIEADFGESLLINDAIQRGASDEIPDLMKNKMLFWTWRTKEVGDLLSWMCEYNKDKPEDERLQYMGVDCQYDIYNSDMLKEYLQNTQAPFLDSADIILDIVKTACLNYFKNYSQGPFNALEDKVKHLQDSMSFYKKFLSDASSAKEFDLNNRILRIIEQTMEVTYYTNSGNNSFDYRDKYMAENAAWLHDYFDGKKIFLWAHNGHIARNSDYYLKSASMGDYLGQDLGDKYIAIGQLFSKGSFNALGYSGGNYTGPVSFTIHDDPKPNSLNAILYNCRTADFALKMSDLQSNEIWTSLFIFPKIVPILSVGAVYTGNPANYYATFYPRYFDYLFYLDNTSASHFISN